MNNDKARHVRVRAVVAYPALLVAVVVSSALVLAPSPVMALEVAPTPPATTAPTATPLTTPPATTLKAAPSTAGATPNPTTITSASSGGTPGIPVDHHVLARIEESGVAAQYLAVDAPITDASQFQSIRMRFKLHNAGTALITAAPQLEYRAHGSTRYTVVPEELLKGIPFRVDREWVPSLAPGGGTKQGPIGEEIAVDKLLTGNEGGGLAVVGHHSMGANPDRAITLPTHSYTEQEFTVLLTMDAKYLTTYEFRITNGHTMLAGSQVATIRLGAPPVLKLSPGQHKGVAVEGPKPARRTGVAK
jgi:hypothetical protein